MFENIKAAMAGYMHQCGAWAAWLCGWLAATILELGYPGIVFLMAVESSFIPFPSEIIMPPAGYLVHEGQMSWFMVIFCGTLGSVVGAWINYFLALRLGRPFLVRHGRYFFLKPDSLEKAERFFTNHGEITTFVGRLTPVIRQLISIPAGLARMNPWKFTAYTALGAGVWVTILTWAGWLVGREKELLREVMRNATAWTLVLLAVLVAAYVKYWRWRKARPSAAAPAPDDDAEAGGEGHAP